MMIIFGKLYFAVTGRWSRGFKSFFLPVVFGALEESGFSFDLEAHAKFLQIGHSFLRGPGQN